MFHAPIGRFQLELIYYLTYFSTSSHPTVVCFFPVGLLCQATEESSTPTRPVENVVLTTGKKHTTVGWDHCEK